MHGQNIKKNRDALQPKKYSKIPLVRPPFGLPKSGLINELVLISKIKSKEWCHFGLAKTGLTGEVVFISSGLKSEILLYNDRRIFEQS